ncbi:MAG: hypothetical protein H8D67_17270 [Deltaproteobacteria bacterium]|nr:hypothetical protein [Deltaproteobacteria bacterium]MBL7075348.1 hypothetical protein [candidate division KSB1 bacterium]
MGRYEKYHNVVSDPITNIVDVLTGTTTTKTVMVDKETGKRAEAYGSSYKETLCANDSETLPPQ